MILGAESARALSALLPRRLRVGTIILDLLHRDACLDDRWAGLYPREFELFWHMAERPRIIHSRTDLLRLVWRTHHDPQTKRVEVAIARIRAKLKRLGVESLIITGEDGGYCIEAQVEALGLDPAMHDLLRLDRTLHLGQIDR